MLVPSAADEERLLLHCGIFEPLPLLLVILLLVELASFLSNVLSSPRSPPSLPNQILMSAFCTDQELLAHPLIAPPGIPGQLLLSVLVKMRKQRGDSPDIFSH